MVWLKITLVLVSWLALTPIGQAAEAFAQPPHLDWRGTAGSRVLSVSGELRVPTLIEFSTNTQDWRPWGLNPQDESVMSFHLPQTDAMEFFRARLLDEVFFGPFANWLDLKREFGAVGDGVADDTAALQRALDALRPWTGPPALFIPAGTYRITGGLRVLRAAHSESKDLIIMGDSPLNTRIVWDGPADGVMLEFGAWYGKLGRVTLDGRGRARTAITHGLEFSTHNEFTDLMFTDLKFGIEAGRMTGPGNAETVVRRCHFERCREVAISIQDWNSLDWFVWDSAFVDCGRGVANIHGAGNFHVYRSRFARSAAADINIGNTLYFSIRDCVSVDSRAFFVAYTNGAPAMQTIQRNHVRRPRDIPVVIGNRGSLLLFDNVIDSGKGPAVHFPNPQGGLLSVGNQFTSAAPYSGGAPPAGFHNFTGLKTLPAPPVLQRALPPRLEAYVQEIPPGLTTAQIQARLDQAVRIDSPLKVVHFQAGTHRTYAPLCLTNAHGLWIVGDGGKSGLVWSAPTNGPLFQIRGPGRIQFQDLFLNGNLRGDGIVFEGLDATGGRVAMDQVSVYNSRQTGLLVDRLASIDVNLENFYHTTCELGVKVVGPAAAPPPAASQGRVAIFGGGSAGNSLSYDVTDGGELLVQDVWYEASEVSQPRFMVCTNRGNFTLHGANVAPRHSTSAQPAIQLDGFEGRFTMLATQLTFPETALLVDDVAGKTSALLAGVVAPRQPNLNLHPDKAALLHNTLFRPENPPAPITNWGNLGTPFLVEMLAQTRGQHPTPALPFPPGIADVRLSRVWIFHAPTGIRLAP